MVSARSPLMEQQTHPFSSKSVFSTLDFTSKLSIPISPNSFIINAVFCISSEFSKVDISVVLPLPRKPVIMDTGIRSIYLNIYFLDNTHIKYLHIITQVSRWPLIERPSIFTFKFY